MPMPDKDDIREREEWIEKWAMETDANAETMEVAVRMATHIENWSGHPARTVAAALVYHASEATPADLTQSEVASFFDTTPKTIRNVWEKLEPQLDDRAPEVDSD